MHIIERFFRALGFDYDDGKRCKCGEHKDCVSNIVIDGPGVLSRKNMYKCGEFKRQVELASEIVRRS